MNWFNEKSNLKWTENQAFYKGKLVEFMLTIKFSLPLPLYEYMYVCGHSL